MTNKLVYQLAHAYIHCKSLETSHDFYHKTLGLPCLDYRPALGYCLLDTGTCKLVLMTILTQRKQK